MSRRASRAASVGRCRWAPCYCLEPHVSPKEADRERPRREVRAAMVARIRTGGTCGYLVYVGGTPVGWVNASPRADHELFQTVDPDGPDPASVIGVSCFVVAPPYRRHGVASRLLDRVIADAHARNARWIEAYPRHDPEQTDAGHFNGLASMDDTRGFEPVEHRYRDTVVRRRAGDNDQVS